jgi:exopolysaccharide biosynthesis polyprenyl glycosylphosphotransferase
MLWRSSLNSALAELADFATAGLAFLVSHYLWSGLHDSYPSTFPQPFQVDGQVIVVVAAACLGYVLLFKTHKAYAFLRFTSLRTEFLIVFKVVTWTLLLGLLFIEMIGHPDLPRTFVVLSYLISMILFLAQKGLLFFGAKILRKRGVNRKRILIIGASQSAADLIQAIDRNFEWGLDIIGVVSDTEVDADKTIGGHKILGSGKSLGQILTAANPEEVLVALSADRGGGFADVFEVCEREGVPVRVTANSLGTRAKSVSVDRVFGIDILSFIVADQPDLSLFAKRVLDIVGASLALVLFAPLMIVAAVGILVSDGLPILYQWNVVGFNRKAFRSWKFRTMCRNADELKEKLMQQNQMQGPVFKINDDPRVIPFCRWLRRWSIDETPQLFSVLKGDMSLVGPRPAGPHELVRYQSWQRRKLSVKPGITCLWQANGRNDISNFDDWVKMDLKYIDNWSLWLDIKILFRTIPAVLSGKGAS